MIFMSNSLNKLLSTFLLLFIGSSLLLHFFIDFFCQRQRRITGKMYVKSEQNKRSKQVNRVVAAREATSEHACPAQLELSFRMRISI